MAVKIPFKNFPAFVERVAIDGVPYRLRFWWNTTGEYWTMQILSATGSVILSGIKLVLNYELIHDFAWLGGPPGELYAVDPTGELTRIGREDLPQGNVYLRYIPAGEL